MFLSYRTCLITTFTLQLLISYVFVLAHTVLSASSFPRRHVALSTAANAIPKMLLKSIAINTVKSYAQGLLTWNKWYHAHPEINVLPVRGFHLATFIVSVIQSNGRFEKIEGVYNGLNWIHSMLGFTNPCTSSIVQSLKEVAKRLLSRPVRKKEPFSPRDIKKLSKKLKKSTLIDLRALTIVTLSYAGFLRYDEMSRIRREHILFDDTHMKIFIDKSKADQHNVGDWVQLPSPVGARVQSSSRNATWRKLMSDRRDSYSMRLIVAKGGMSYGRSTSQLVIPQCHNTWTCWMRSLLSVWSVHVSGYILCGVEEPPMRPTPE